MPFVYLFCNLCWWCLTFSLSSRTLSFWVQKGHRTRLGADCGTFQEYTSSKGLRSPAKIWFVFVRVCRGLSQIWCTQCCVGFRAENCFILPVERRLLFTTGNGNKDTAAVCCNIWPRSHYSLFLSFPKIVTCMISITTLGELKMRKTKNQHSEKVVLNWLVCLFAPGAGRSSRAGYCCHYQYAGHCHSQYHACNIARALPLRCWQKNAAFFRNHLLFLSSESRLSPADTCFRFFENL